MHILIVDDDAQVRRTLARLLRSYGFTILGEAEHGEAALGMLAGASVDLVVTDCQMPVMDGIRFVRRLRQSGQQVPVIMLSGQGDPMIIQLARDAGVTDYLPKPMDPQLLIDRVHRALGVVPSAA